MCGIAGIVEHAPSRHPASSQAMDRMLAALAHRGPDDVGALQDGAGILGQRRLSIIDLAGGRQPISNARGDRHVVCNGEIYNWRELRGSLEQRGYRFKTASDTEVILHLYEEYGTDCLQHLRGMFAFAIWDSRENRLFAARDHLGQKPLFYAAGGGRLLIASEIKALTAVDGGLRKLSPQALDQYLALRIICPPRTMFQGVHKLPPAHYLLYRPGGEPEIRRYWDLDFSEKTRTREADLLDELHAIVVDTLRHHMVSDVPVGALLSGGLDSSMVVAMLCRDLGVRDLPTFTVGIPHPQFNEAADARRVADRYGTEHHELVTVPSVADNLPEVVYHLDEPSDPLSVCTWTVSKLARESVKVVLGGDGGDELFGGYDRYYGNLYAGWYARVPALLRRNVAGPLLATVPDGAWYKSKSHQVKWLHELSFLDGGRRYARSLSYFQFTPELRRELYTVRMFDLLRGADAEADMVGYYDAAPADSPVDRMLYTDTRSRLPDHPVMISDRMSMAHGLEVRSPFMDHRLAEFCARLPSRYKIRGLTLRYLQRKLAARYLPPETLSKPKQGFSSALPYLLKDEYKKVFRSMLPHSRLVAEGYLAAKPIEALLAAHLSDARDHGNRLWLLASLEAWYRIHIEGQSVAEFRQELAENGNPRTGRAAAV
ncbi:MAG TPA: asparagine synthase (glutamine-hydrolyzing) [Woeseiaceae bacterium]|nr:asparagine synthase (glutamine-hydrolyzing) [Woeseiaceae bacterium]